MDKGVDSGGSGGGSPPIRLNGPWALAPFNTEKYDTVISKFEK